MALFHEDGREVSGAGYARAPLEGLPFAPTARIWQDGQATMTMENLSRIVFPRAVGAWGKVTHFGFASGAKGDGLLIGTLFLLTVPMNIGADMTLSFEPGFLAIAQHR